MRLMAADVESSGSLPEFALQPWRYQQGKAWLTSLSVARYDEHGQVVHSGGLHPTQADLEAFLVEAIDTGSRIATWNGTFDIMWFIAYGCGDLVFKAKWLDGMRLWRHYWIEPEYELARAKKKSYGLKACVNEYLPHLAGYEQDIDFHTTDPEQLAKLQEYNDIDTAATLALTEKWWGLLTPAQQRVALIEAASIPHIAQANLQGMLVDMVAARDLGARLDAVASQCLAELESDGVTEKVVRSPTQLAKLIFDQWGLPVYKENTSKKTGKVSRSTDKEVLHELSFIDPRAKQLRAYREALGNKAKFSDAIVESVAYNEDGRTHPEAILFGTYSGRLTYASKQGKNKDARQTGFALHQEKRDSLYRDVIVAPPGYGLVEFDASGQEYRWMAIMSGDPTMMQLCQPGEDPHSFMGSRIVGRDYKELVAEVKDGDVEAKSFRQLGKVSNLSAQYRTSAKKLRVIARVQYDIPMELSEAQRIHRTYQHTYPMVPRYWQSQIQKTKRRGYVENLAGRRVQVVGDWTGSLAWSMESTSINYPVQGIGAEQKYLALAVLSPYIRKIGGYFAWDLHDGLYFYIPLDKVKKAAVEIKDILDNLPYRKAWGFTPPIPLPWDCKVGHSWGDLKEFKE